MSHVPFPVEKTVKFIDHRSSAKDGAVLRIDGTITASITSLSMFIVGDDGVERTEPYALTPYDVSYVDGHLTHLRKFKDEFGIWQEVREEFVRVPAHNTEGISPVAFTYHVDLMVFEDGSFVEHVEFDVAAPVGETVNLSNVAPVAASNGVQIVRGPKGEKGDTGAPGQVGPAGQQWRGMWDAETDYVNADAVSFSGSSWFAAGDPPVGEEPSDESVFWNVLSQQGAQGDKGDKGDPGESVIGPPGATPNITPAVNELPAGSPMTVTKTGSPTDVTFTFGLPVPAAPAPSEGGGGGGARTTGWYRRSVNNGGYLYLCRDELVVRGFLNIQMPKSAVYRDLINFGGGGAPGFSVPTQSGEQSFHMIPSNANSKMHGNLHLLVDNGYMQADFYNWTVDEAGVGSSTYQTEFQYDTFDAFPDVVVLPGFTKLPDNPTRIQFFA